MSAHGIPGRLGARLARLDPDHLLIARRMAVVMGFALLAKLVGAAKEVVLAWRYGISEIVDAYVFVFSLVNLPVSIWLSILTVVFIPLAARIRQNSPASLPGFRAELLGFTILLGIVLGAAAALGLTALFQSSLSGLGAGAREIALAATPVMAALIPLGLVIHYGSVLLMAEGKNANTLFEGIPAAVILIVLLAFASRGAAPLVWGTLAGFALHALVMLGVLRGRGVLHLPRFAFRSPAWQFFWTGIGVMLLAQILQSLTGVIDQFFAARLGEGAVSTLSYAQRVLSLILTLGALALARAILPVFSELRARERGSVDALAMRWVRIMLVLGAAVAVAGWLAAPAAIQLLYERGAFTADDTERVVEVFRFGLLQVPFYCAAIILMQVASSARVYRFLLVMAVVKLMVKLAGNYFLAEPFGLQGLMMASALMDLAAVLTLLVLTRRLRSRHGRE